jgi:hypothetical protein
MIMTAKHLHAFLLEAPKQVEAILHHGTSAILEALCDLNPRPSTFLMLLEQKNILFGSPISVRDARSHIILPSLPALARLSALDLVSDQGPVASTADFNRALEQAILCWCPLDM